MRVAVVGGYPPDPYGEAHYSGKAFMAFAQLFPNVDITIFAHINANKPDFEQICPNLRIVRVTKPGKRLYATAAMLPLIQSVLRFKPSVVHFQGTHTPNYGGLWGEPATGMIALLRGLHIPSLMTVHSTWMPSDLDDLARKKNIGAAQTRLIHWYYRANLVALTKQLGFMNICSAGDNSPVIAEFMSSWRICAERVCGEAHPCTYDPISLEKQNSAKQSLGLIGKKIILAMGFIRPDKGYHILLDCAKDVLARHHDAVVIVAGEPRGTDAHDYVESLRQRRLQCTTKDRIILRFEYLSDEELETLFYASDIVIVPYLRVIGPSGPIHHALGRGKPVIATALGHNLGLANTCKLVTPNDPNSLSRAIDEFLSRPEAIVEYQRRSSEYASRHTWNHLAQQYMTQYEKLIA